MMETLWVADDQREERTKKVLVVSSRIGKKYDVLCYNINTASFISQEGKRLVTYDSLRVLKKSCRLLAR